MTETKNVPIDPNGWNLITDAMSRVLLPEGTAPSAHIPGIDIAGKTGSAQVVSLATRAKFKNSETLAQNGWFVGFTPRRNPDIVVCVLFEGGEHGRLAARLATQVLKAYVDKQRRMPTEDGGEAEGWRQSRNRSSVDRARTATKSGWWAVLRRCRGSRCRLRPRRRGCIELCCGRS